MSSSFIFAKFAKKEIGRKLLLGMIVASGVAMAATVAQTNPQTGINGPASAVESAARKEAGNTPCSPDLTPPCGNLAKSASATTMDAPLVTNNSMSAGAYPWKDHPAGYEKSVHAETRRFNN